MKYRGKTAVLVSPKAEQNLEIGVSPEVSMAMKLLTIRMSLALIICVVLAGCLQRQPDGSSMSSTNASALNHQVSIYRANPGR